jgi:glucuronosyltransferase
MNARDTAVYWVEYVIRHHGAPHIQYPGVHLNFWQSTSLDVVGFLIVMVYAGLKISMMVLQFVWGKVFKSKPKTVRGKKTN